MNEVGLMLTLILLMLIVFTVGFLLGKKNP